MDARMAHGLLWTADCQIKDPIFEEGNEGRLRMISLRKAVGHIPWAEAFVLCPAGATELTQGFNPGNPLNKGFALKKGREMRVPDEAPICRAKVRVRDRTCDKLDHRTPFPPC